MLDRHRTQWRKTVEYPPYLHRSPRDHGPQRQQVAGADSDRRLQATAFILRIGPVSKAAMPLSQRQGNARYVDADLVGCSVGWDHCPVREVPCSDARDNGPKLRYRRATDPTRVYLWFSFRCGLVSRPAHADRPKVSFVETARCRLVRGRPARFP